VSEPNCTACNYLERLVARNDSIIVDYFQGQLKSTLTCPVNQRVSTTFDPFMYLTIPIPIKNTRKIIVKVYWMSPKHYPEKYGVTVEKDGNIGDLMRELSKLCKIPAKNLVIVEVFANRFHCQFYPCDDISDNAALQVSSGKRTE